MQNSQIHSAPPEALNFDLAVIGGGLAGLCAAVAAARQGVKVAIVQDRPVFGGNCSSEIRVVPHGSGHSNAWAAEIGLPLEILLEDRAQNHECFFDHGMINARFDLLLKEVAMREPNLTVFLNTTVRAVDSAPIPGEIPRQAQPTSNGLGRLGGENRRIGGIRASQMGSEREFLILARQFLDATGDGTVGFLAGADFRYGREARREFGENLAPVEADDTTMGATITMRARDIGQAAPFTPPPWIQLYRTPEEIGYRKTLYHITQPVYGGYWWLEVCNPFHQIRDNAEIRDELHRHVLGVWNFIKNHADFRDKATNYVLDWIGMVPGKRESRRLVGDITVTEQHCHTNPDFPDAIADAGWWIDLHMKGGILNKVDPGERENVDRNYKHWIRIPMFRLPLRAFYSRNVENLWMAGRCLSTTHVALGPVRCMQTLSMMGHAVGIAAAYALKHGLSPRETAHPQGPHIQPLQQVMLRDDIRILGRRNADPTDLALAAKASASSEATLDLSALRSSPEWFHLGDNHRAEIRESPGLAVVVPLTEPRLEQVELYLKNVSAQAQAATVELHQLTRIWDRPDQPALAKSLIDVPAGFEGWCVVHFDLVIEPGRPYRIALTGGQGLAWAANAAPPGVVMQYLHESSGGCEPRNAHLPSFAPTEVDIPAYRHWRQLKTCLTLRTAPIQRPFSPANVNDGCAWVEDLPHLWISDPARMLPQFIQLDFGREVRLGRIEVAFDTNLSRGTQSAEAFFRAPECVKDWRVLAQTTEGEWREVYRETGNIQRRRRVTFTPVETTAVRLEILATNGAAEARVFEIRAYSA